MRDALQLLRLLASEGAAAAAPRVLEAGVALSNALERLSVRLEAPDPRWAGAKAAEAERYAVDLGLFQVIPEGEMKPYIEALNATAKDMAQQYLRRARGE